MKPLKILLLFLLIIAAFQSALPAKEIAEKEKLQSIKKQLELQKKTLRKTKLKEQRSLSKMVEMKLDLKKTKNDLYRAKRNIAVNQKNIQELLGELKEANHSLKLKSYRLKKRIKEVYKSSAVNYLDLILGAKSMSDFINRAHFFSKIMEKDAKLIEELTGEYKRTKAKRKTLVERTGQIRYLASVIEDKKGKIANQAQKEKELYESLKVRRREAERRIQELEESSEELEKIILAKTRRKATYTGTGSLDWPLRGRITSRFGYRRHPLWGGRHLHTGLDIAGPYGEVVRAADGGEVIFTGWWDGYGKAVVIDHGKQRSTVYGHLSRIYVSNGGRIRKGQIIGLVGSTGYSTGPHLHFEVRISGKPKNPMRYLP